MRVTKYIKDYVTEEVSRIYDAKKNPYQAEKDTWEENLAEFRKTLTEEIKARVQAFADKNGCLNYKGEPYSADVSVAVPNFGYMHAKCSDDYYKWRDAHVKEKNNKIREILISLELGETSKVELTGLIANLTKEMN